jgi:NAD(P)-dependent dehydrogenase (short-subunit alcohol dehydrogenase family)
MDYADKIVVVTGAGSGIGREAVFSFARRRGPRRRRRHQPRRRQRDGCPGLIVGSMSGTLTSPTRP